MHLLNDGSLLPLGRGHCDQAPGPRLGLTSAQASPDVAVATAWQPSGEHSLISKLTKSLKTHLFPN